MTDGPGGGVPDRPTDAELEAIVNASPPRGYRGLMIGSIVSGVLCFGSTVWMSQLLAPADSQSTVSITPLLLALLVGFGVTLAGCIAMGYMAARRKPPSS
jgi:uncharacterized membrane protein YedE/YeeE